MRAKYLTIADNIEPLVRLMIIQIYDKWTHSISTKYVFTQREMKNVFSQLSLSLMIAPYRYVRWSRDDMLLVDSRYPALTPPPRYQLWTNGSLEVAQVQMDDTGDYMCEIITEAGKAIQRHAIEVQCEWGN